MSAPSGYLLIHHLREAHPVGFKLWNLFDDLGIAQISTVTEDAAANSGTDAAMGFKRCIAIPKCRGQIHPSLPPSAHSRAPREFGA